MYVTHMKLDAATGQELGSVENKGTELTVSLLYMWVGYVICHHTQIDWGQIYIYATFLSDVLAQTDQWIGQPQVIHLNRFVHMNVPSAVS